MNVVYRYRVKNLSGELNRQARANRYFTGKPCKRGHIAERRTDNGNCIVCDREKSAERRKNNPAAKRKANAVYYAKHKDKCDALNAAWRAKNRKRMTALRNRHYQENKSLYNARAKARKEHIRRATPPWADMLSIVAVYEEARRLTLETGIPHDVDHIIPLRSKLVCGLHVHWNLRPLPASINRSRGAVHDRDHNAALNMLARSGHRAPVEGIAA